MSVKASSNRIFNNQRTLLDIASNVPVEQSVDRMSELTSLPSGPASDMTVEPHCNGNSNDGISEKGLETRDQINDDKILTQESKSNEKEKPLSDAGDSRVEQPNAEATDSVKTTTSNDLEVPLSTTDPSPHPEKKSEDLHADEK